MLIFSVFKTLINKEITVELNDGSKISGKLESLDQFHNISLKDITVHNPECCPHLSLCSDLFIRAPFIYQVELPKAFIDTDLLEDATRREMMNFKNESITTLQTIA